jgi:hypothetical protein
MKPTGPNVAWPQAAEPQASPVALVREQARPNLERMEEGARPAQAGSWRFARLRRDAPKLIQNVLETPHFQRLNVTFPDLRAIPSSFLPFSLSAVTRHPAGRLPAPDPPRN